MIDYRHSKYIDTSCPFATLDLSILIVDHLASHIDLYEPLVILCIGTDRSTGDSLGPLVGHKLKPRLNYYRQIHLLGTLDDPIHAKNLESSISQIHHRYSNPLILAIDASLGGLNKIGYIGVRNGPLKPGSGVNKELPIIGDISITGVVNVGGVAGHMVLQNTRLSLVMNMADIIYRGIFRAILELYKDKKMERIIRI